MEYSEVVDMLHKHGSTDFLNVASDPILVHLLSHVGSSVETIEFSDVAIKLNYKGKAQYRHLVITNKAIYNFTPYQYAKPKRRIPINSLFGLIVSESSDQLLFKVRDDYDYLFKLVKRADLVEVVARCHQQSNPAQEMFVLLVVRDLESFRFFLSFFVFF
jgi:hypothetical protein